MILFKDFTRMHSMSVLLLMPSDFLPSMHSVLPLFAAGFFKTQFEDGRLKI